MQGSALQAALSKGHILRLLMQQEANVNAQAREDLVEMRYRQRHQDVDLQLSGGCWCEAQT